MQLETSTLTSCLERTTRLKNFYQIHYDLSEWKLGRMGGRWDKDHDGGWVDADAGQSSVDQHHCRPVFHQRQLPNLQEPIINELLRRDRQESKVIKHTSNLEPAFRRRSPIMGQRLSNTNLSPQSSPSLATRWSRSTSCHPPLARLTSRTSGVVFHQL